jgi:hypothetical protein
MKKMIALSLVILLFQMTQGYATVANPWLPMSLQCGEFSDSNCYLRQASFLSKNGANSLEMTRLMDSMNPIMGQLNFGNVGRAPAVFNNSRLGVNDFTNAGFFTPGINHVAPNFVTNQGRFFGGDRNIASATSIDATSFTGSRSPAIIDVVSPR